MGSTSRRREAAGGHAQDSKSDHHVDGLSDGDAANAKPNGDCAPPEPRGRHRASDHDEFTQQPFDLSGACFSSEAPCNTSSTGAQVANDDGFPAKRRAQPPHPRQVAVATQVADPRRSCPRRSRAATFPHCVQIALPPDARELLACLLGD